MGGGVCACAYVCVPYAQQGCAKTPSSPGVLTVAAQTPHTF